MARDQQPTCIPHEGEDWTTDVREKATRGSFTGMRGGAGLAGQDGRGHGVAGALGLLAHLEQGVDGCVPVPSLGFQHGADHLPVHVGEHVLDGSQVLLAAAGRGAHGCWGQGHGHHAGAAHRRHTCKHRTQSGEHVAAPAPTLSAGPASKDVHPLPAAPRTSPLPAAPLPSGCTLHAASLEPTRAARAVVPSNSRMTPQRPMFTDRRP